MKCECGNTIDKDTKKCENCGKIFENNPIFEANNSEKSKNESIIETEINQTEVQIIDNKNSIDLENENQQETKNMKESLSKSRNKVFALAFGAVFIILFAKIFINSTKLVDANDYPYCVINTNGLKIKSNDTIEIIQDGLLVTTEKYNLDKKYYVFLDKDKNIGDRTKVEVKVNGEILDESEFRINSTIFDDLFTNSRIVVDQYPELAIKVKMNPVIIEKNLINELAMNIDGVDYPYTKCIANGDGTSTIYFDIDGAKRKSDFAFEYHYDILNKEDKVEGNLELKKYDNVRIEKIKSDYSEYPLVRHYFNVYDNSTGNQINQSLTPEDFSLYENIANTKTKVENTNIVDVNNAGKASIELVADVSGSVDYSGLQESKDSLKAFLDVVDFASYDEVELLSFSDLVYEEQRYTNNKGKLVKSVDNLDLVSQTALYDALGHALERTVIQRGSKMIIATTDGYENASTKYDYKMVVEKAKEYQIPIYIVGVGSDIDTSILKLLTNATGGEFINVDSFNELSEKFTEIYKTGKDGFVVEYNVNDVSSENADVIITLESNGYGGETVIKYEPIFVSWGGNNRIDDIETPYDERVFDSNYYDDTHSYEIIFEDVSWQEANQKAVQKGGYLARITSEEEFDVIVSEIEKATTSKAYLYWLGGSRTNSVDGQYTWVDQDLNVMSETLPENIWLEGEPSYREYDANGNILFEEEYLNMFYVENIDKWVMNDCTDDVLSKYDAFKGKVAYVIEYEKK